MITDYQVLFFKTHPGERPPSEADLWPMDQWEPTGDPQQIFIWWSDSGDAEALQGAIIRDSSYTGQHPRAEPAQLCAQDAQDAAAGGDHQTQADQHVSHGAVCIIHFRSLVLDHVHGFNLVRWVSIFPYHCLQNCWIALCIKECLQPKNNGPAWFWFLIYLRMFKVQSFTQI